MSFTLIETQSLPDIHSIGKLYRHEQTGAQVLHLDNDDENKAFSIAFKTPPYSDNGITHILEHSVLNGSERFPSKEPFVELLKSSMNTFLNAMTYSDKTVYPVASTNDKDFLNLMRVYLDAVFKPNLRNNPQILAQEGWHYHLESPEDDLIYKGVVYNEMKGALSSPERALYQATLKKLYPETLYTWESGGDPRAIPELTQEEFVDYHQTYYHPTHTLTVVYGNINEAQVFEELSHYFDQYTMNTQPVDYTFELQVPSNEDVHDTYSITEGDNPEDKAYLGLSWHVAEADDTLDIMGMQVLNSVLLDNNDSPLKKALIQAQLGGDISAGVQEVGWPVMYTIEIQDAKTSKMAKFKQVVNDTLHHIVQNGLDSELIESSLNRHKFALREAAISEGNPRGVLYGLTAMSNWLYGGSPFENLQFNDYLDQLTDKVSERYFESLIEEKILNNPYKVAVVLEAQPGKNDQLEQERLQLLQEYKETLDSSQIDAFIKETQALIQRQETPDSPEDLAKIPTLEREDLSSDIEADNLDTIDLFEETTLYYSDQFTSEIDYVNYYFDISDFSQDEFGPVDILTGLIGNLETENYSLSDFKKTVNQYTGGIHAGHVVYQNQDGEVKPFLYLRGKALFENLDSLIDLMTESLFNLKIENVEQVTQIIQSIKADLDDKIDYSAHQLASDYVLSQFNIAHALKDQSSGIHYFQYLKQVLSQLKEGNGSELLAQLNELLTRLKDPARIHGLYVGDANRVQKVKDKMVQSIGTSHERRKGKPATYHLNKQENIAFVTSQDVNYVAMGTKDDTMADKHGSDEVMATMLRYDYLWNTIRVMGGAYGAMYRHDNLGNVNMASYRDPNIIETLQAYEKVHEYIEHIDLTEEELLKYIIGTLSPLERPLSAFEKGILAFGRYQTGITNEQRQQNKEQILYTTSDDLKRRLNFYKDWYEDAGRVVIGNKAQIDKHAEIFDRIVELF